MSSDLMHMDGALHLDSSHNDDLFIFGAVFIGGYARRLIRSGHANDQFINGSPNGKTEMRETQTELVLFNGIFDWIILPIFPFRFDRQFDNLISYWLLLLKKKRHFSVFGFFFFHLVEWKSINISNRKTTNLRVYFFKYERIVSRISNDQSQTSTPVLNSHNANESYHSYSLNIEKRRAF